jgi:hypothetical protein
MGRGENQISAANVRWNRRAYLEGKETAIHEVDHSEPKAPDLYSLEALQLSIEDVDKLTRENPSLRSFMVGYAAEHHLHKYLQSLDGVTDLGKPDDHDRGNKGDRLIAYKGKEYRLESKSLQSASIKTAPDGTKTGKAQIDASDKREVVFPDGSKLGTTCLLATDLDIVALNLYAFGEGWKFGFIHVDDLPRTTYNKYTPYQREHLLATSLSLSWPLDDSIKTDLKDLLK